MFELIDTLWNVNQHTHANYAKRTNELIDTLWNVNDLDLYLKCYNFSELIDTLWNVNIASDIADAV